MDSDKEFKPLFIDSDEESASPIPSVQHLLVTWRDNSTKLHRLEPLGVESDGNFGPIVGKSKASSTAPQYIIPNHSAVTQQNGNSDWLTNGFEAFPSNSSCHLTEQSALSQHPLRESLDAVSLPNSQIVIDLTHRSAAGESLPSSIKSNGIISDLSGLSPSVVASCSSLDSVSNSTVATNTAVSDFSYTDSALLRLCEAVRGNQISSFEEEQTLLEWPVTKEGMASAEHAVHQPNMYSTLSQQPIDDSSAVLSPATSVRSSETRSVGHSDAVHSDLLGADVSSPFTASSSSSQRAVNATEDDIVCSVSRSGLVSNDLPPPAAFSATTSDAGWADTEVGRSSAPVLRSQSPSTAGSIDTSLSAYLKRPGTVQDIIRQLPDALNGFPYETVDASYRDSSVGFMVARGGSFGSLNETRPSLGNTSLVHQYKQPLVASTPFVQRSAEPASVGRQADEPLSDSGRASSPASVDLCRRSADLELMQIFYGGREMADFISAADDDDEGHLQLADLSSDRSALSDDARAAKLTTGNVQIVVGRADPEKREYGVPLNVALPVADQATVNDDERQTSSPAMSDVALPSRRSNRVVSSGSEVLSYDKLNGAYRSSSYADDGLTGSAETSAAASGGNGSSSVSVGPTDTFTTRSVVDVNSDRLYADAGMSAPMSARSASSDEYLYDDDLGEDVKRILAKYRIYFSSKSSSSRSEDVTALPHSSVAVGSNVEIKPAGSDNILMLESGDPLLSDSGPSTARTDKVDAASVSSSDTLARRVRGLLAKEQLSSTTSAAELECSQKTAGARGSSYLLDGGSLPSGGSSRTASVDYGSLSKDLDDIQASLESMRNSEKASLSSRHSSFSSVSSLSGFNLQDVTAVRQCFVADLAQNSKNVDSSRTSLPQNTDNISGDEDEDARRVSVNPLLTSGVLPIDVALDLLHGTSDGFRDDYSDASKLSDFGDLKYDILAKTDEPVIGSCQMLAQEDDSEAASGISIADGGEALHLEKDALRFENDKLHQRDMALGGSDVLENRPSYLNNSERLQTTADRKLTVAEDNLHGIASSLSDAIQDSRLAAVGNTGYGLTESSSLDAVAYRQSAVPRTVSEPLIQRGATASIPNRVGSINVSHERVSFADASTVEDVLYDTSRDLSPLSFQHGGVPSIASSLIASLPAWSHGPEVSVMSERSYSDRVQDVFERGSPPRQAYEYLREADELKKMMAHDLDGSVSVASRDEYYLGDMTYEDGAGLSGSLDVSSMPRHSPFDVMKSVRPLFTLQLDRVSAADFDQSVELPVVDDRFSDVEFSQQRHVDQSNSRLYDQLLETSAADLGRAGISRDSTAAERPIIRSSGDGDYFTANSGSRFDQVLNSRLNTLLEDDTPRLVDTEVSREFGSERNDGLANHKSNSVLDNPSFESPLMGHGSKQSSPAALTPYQPGGSHEVYYIDSSAEEMSIAVSETTVESTHPGSDDAKAPNFPPHVYGSRADGPPGAVGIYNKLKPSPPPVSNDLCTIDEVTSSASDCKDVRSGGSRARSSSSKSASSEKSRRLEKEQALLKAQAWVSDVNASAENIGIDVTTSDGNPPSRRVIPPDIQTLSSTRSTGDVGKVSSTGGKHKPELNISGGPRPSSSVGTLLTSGALTSSNNRERKPEYTPKTNEDDVTSTVYAVRNLSFSESPSKNCAADGPVKTSTNRTTARDAIRDSRGFCTPMKSVDSISALLCDGAAESRPKVAVKSSGATRNLAEDASVASQTRNAVNEYSVGDRYGARFDSHFGLLPGIETLVERYADKSRVPAFGAAAADDDNERNTFEHAITRSLVGSLSRDGRGRTDQRPSYGDPTNDSDNRSCGSGDIVSSVVSSTLNGDGAADSSLIVPPPAGFDESADHNSRSVADAEPQLRQLWERLIHDPLTASRGESSAGRNHVGSSSASWFACVNDVSMQLSSKQSERDRQTDNVRHVTTGHGYENNSRKSTSEFRTEMSHRNGGEAGGNRAVSGGSSSRGGRLFSADWQNSSSDSDRQPSRDSNDNGDECRETRRRRRKTDDGEDEEKQHAVGERTGDGRPSGRQAWIVKDETLPPVPEDMTIESVTSDFTSTSSVDESGKVVTRTTKRHLPDDPRLLRLQQKISQQREKHRRAQANERRRKERIAELEMRLKQEAAMVCEDRKCNRRETGHKPVLIPASVNGDVTATSSTLTTDDPTDLTLGASVPETDQNVTLDGEADGDESTGCVCTCHATGKRSSPSRVNLSPAKRRAAKSEPLLAPEMRHLHEVTYVKGQTATSLPVVGSPKRSSERNRVAVKPGNGRPRFPASPVKRAPTRRDRQLPVQMQWLGGRRSAGKVTAIRQNGDVKIVENDNTTTAGLKGPYESAADDSASAERCVASKGVQTTPRLQRPSYEDMTVISASDVVHRHRQRGSRSSKAFAPESSSSNLVVNEPFDSNVTKKQKTIFQHRPGLAWFVPMNGEDAVFDNPLKEIQKHMDIIQDSISAWYGRDSKQNRLYDESDTGDKENRDVGRSQKSGFNGRSYCDTLSHVLTVMPASLQEAFDATMADFVSRSRERQRYVLLRAEERRIQELEANERLRLFGVGHRRSTNTVADPEAEQLFRPQKRFIGKREIKDLTKRHLKLPEASGATDLKKKVEIVRANYMRRKQYSRTVCRDLKECSS